VSREAEALAEYEFSQMRASEPAPDHEIPKSLNCKLLAIVNLAGIAVAFQYLVER
jgi:hypothetical protein